MFIVMNLIFCLVGMILLFGLIACGNRNMMEYEAINL